MTFLRFTALLLPAFALACTDPEPAPPVSENAHYLRLVDGAPDLETCQRETQGTGFNCHQELTLCTNGAYMLIVTDIINEGRYTIDGDALTATLQSPGDAPATFTVRITDDGIDTSDGLAGEHPWVRTTATDLTSTCAAFEARTWW